MQVLLGPELLGQLHRLKLVEGSFLGVHFKGSLVYNNNCDSNQESIIFTNKLNDWLNRNYPKLFD